MKMQHEEEVWSAYRRQLHRFVAKRVRDHSAAEDITHDVLLKAYSQQDTLKDPGKLRAWLYQMTRNAIVDYFRSNKPLGPLPAELPEEVKISGNTAPKELARCLAPLLKTLPPHYQKPLELVEINGLTQKEMADQLGLSLSGAKSRIQRARKRLAAALLDCCRVEVDRRGGVYDYKPRQGGECC
jgi:RNA polymerase sigma-70 factor, ECF subfamily